ncbi:unnamed protein product, partial [marine sediment metagenome]
MAVSLHETCQEYFRRRLSEGWRCISLEGYNAVLLSPDGIRREIDLRNDVETLRPNAPGDETAIALQFPDSTFHWDKVDEASPDDASTYVYGNPLFDFQRDLYALPASSGSGVINKITVHFRGKEDAATLGVIRASIKSDSTVTDGDTHGFASGRDWESFSQEWATNPADDEAWEWADIDALQIGTRPPRGKGRIQA